MVDTRMNMGHHVYLLLRRLTGIPPMVTAISHP